MLLVCSSESPITSGLSLLESVSLSDRACLSLALELVSLSEISSGESLSEASAESVLLSDSELFSPMVGRRYSVPNFVRRWLLVVSGNVGGKVVVKVRLVMPFGMGCWQKVIGSSS